MKKLFAGLLVLLFTPGFTVAQDRVVDRRDVQVEVEPLSYLFGGAGGTLGYRVGAWEVSLEGYGFTVPESLHGNEGFDSDLLGAELQFERFLGDRPSGFYLGPEVGVSRLEVTREDTGANESRVGVSVGLRAGYRWWTGLGGLYVSPVGGVSYSPGSEDIPVEGRRFETAPVGPWATVGVGWAF